ncbi:MAG: ATP-binding cassette domain-containing protein [Paracoccaceae bacterium]
MDLDCTGLDIDGQHILGQIGLQILPSQTVALMGPSGIGKTSLLRIIAGLETRQSGQCVVNGRVGVVFQEPTLLPWRSIQDNLTIPTGISAQEARQALQDVGLDGRQDDFPRQLSLGQQRRLSLARAFAVKPQLLLLDEPFVSLDPDMVEDMMALFQRLQKTHDVATVFVTHVRAEAMRLSDRIITISGSPGQISADNLNATST